MYAFCFKRPELLQGDKILALFNVIPLLVSILTAILFVTNEPWTNGIVDIKRPLLTDLILYCHQLDSPTVDHYHPLLYHRCLLSDATLIGVAATCLFWILLWVAAMCTRPSGQLTETPPLWGQHVPVIHEKYHQTLEPISPFPHIQYSYQHPVQQMQYDSSYYHRQQGFPPSEKVEISHYGHENNARCKGQWNRLPELARRYVKHNPDGAALEHIVLAEVALVRMTLPWNLKQAQPIQDQLQSVFELNKGISGELKESAKVVLARLFFGSKEYDQVLALLGDLSLLNAQSTGYSFILYYQSLAIKAMSLEAMGDMETCLQLYEHASRLLDHQHPIKDFVLVEWAEEALYRANQLVSSHTFSSTVDDGTILGLLRSYHQTTCHQPVTWRAERRMGTTLDMIKLLTKLYHSGEYIPHASSSTDGLPDAHDDQKAFAQEITQLYTLCELMLQTTSLSKESNRMVLDVIEALANDLDWIVESKEDWRGYKEVLERASEKTFNSPTVLRLLFLTSLRLGEYEEAQHALQSYLQLLGLVSQQYVETQQDGNAPVQNHSDRYLPIPCFAPSTNRLVDTDGPVEEECIGHQVDILVKAMGMFCSELGNGIKAVEMANLALDRVKKYSDLDPQQVAKVYRSSVIDGKVRPKYHEKALGLLEQANKIQPDSWETLYCLARQHADMRHIDQAIYSVHHALTLNPDHVASWHLLALALSCPGQNKQAHALSIASAGLHSTCSSKQVEQHLLLTMTHSRLLCALEGPEKALEAHASLFKLYGKWRSDEDVSGNPWHGRISHGVQTKVPRRITVSGPLGTPSPVPSSSSSSSTIKSRRRRSASSSMIGDTNGFRNCDSALTTNGDASPPPLRKHASNSMLRIPSSNQHHSLRPSSSLGTSLHSSSSNRLDTSISNDSISKQSDKLSSRYNSVYSFQSGASSVGHATSSNASFISTTCSQPVFTTSDYLLQQHYHLRLCELWLMAAEWYLALSDHEQALQAISEAETACPTHPDVWCLLGKINQHQQSYFEKGLVLEPGHPSCQLELAKLYMEQEEFCLAEGVLISMTRGKSWHSPEAWLLLGQIYQQTNRYDQTKACYIYALDLESHEPISPFDILPHIV
ncbi:hypothetical protein BC941DRAFT_518674 [Chlamydoabsidia padenii]|nr:hypothetical protein BC941DRAFT_518674 [Chlamydoabsidia padenii]